MPSPQALIEGFKRSVMDLKRLKLLIDPVLTPLGYELVDVRYVVEQGRSIMRVMIDCEGGVKVDDCERASREIETLLEVEGDIRDRYHLEVSSPGLNRPLVKEADFVRFTGKVAAVKTREPIDEYGGRRNYKGLLKGVEEGRAVMLIDGQEYRVPINLIEKANLVF